MGYSIRPGTSIKDFWPDDTPTEMYLMSGGHTIQDLIDLAKEKWPNANFEDISISSQKIHTQCLTHDVYDGSDYTDFLILECHKV